MKKETTSKKDKQEKTMWEDQLWHEMKRIRKNINRFLGRSDFPEKSLESRNYRHAWADLTDNENKYEISVEVPGVNKEDIQLEIIDQKRISIRAEKKKETQRNTQEEGVSHQSYTRSYIGFYRTFDLPQDADVKNIEAEYKNGILKICMPRKKDNKKKNLVKIK
jgi:HSP20 family protein